MSLTFLILACLTLGSAVAAMTLRNLVHCALALTLTFAGLAAIYLQLGAQFVGFAQVLVYIGAVAILIVFAILLTRAGGSKEEALFSSGWLWGIVTAVAVFGVLALVILSSKATTPAVTTLRQAPVREIGEKLMTQYILPLEVLGILLTAALIGAVVIAVQEKRSS